MTYPHQSGDVTVIGPECFASSDGSVICWQGENYYRQSPGDTCPRCLERMEFHHGAECPPPL